MRAVRPPTFALAGVPIRLLLRAGKTPYAPR